MHKQNVNVNVNVFQMMTVRLATVLVLGCLIAFVSGFNLTDENWLKKYECAVGCDVPFYTCVKPCVTPSIPYQDIHECNGVDCIGLDRKCVDACWQQ